MPSDAPTLVSLLAARLPPPGTEITIQVTEDWSGFVASCAALGKYAPAPLFDPARSEIPAFDAFWMRVAMLGNRLVGLQTFQAVRLGSAETLADHVFARRRAYRPGDVDVDPDRLEFLPAPNWGVSNRVGCYHGELWLAPAARGSAYSRSIVAAGFAEVVRRWDATFLFGLTLPQTSNWRFMRLIGYTDLVVPALIWRDAAGRIVRQEGLGWADRRALLAAAQAAGNGGSAMSSVIFANE